MPRFDVINSWTAPGNATAPGAYPIDHGTMCAYDALIAAPKATLLDYPMLSSTLPGGAFSGQTLSVAVQAYAALIAFWAVAFAPGGAPKYKALVVNNSWGMFHPSWDFPAGHPGRYIDNPNHPFAGLIGVLTRAGADILFAAGNCGTECPSGRCENRTTETIMGASTYPDVLTLAGCDVNDDRVGYSSQGPSIRGMYPQKPDLTAYTHFIGCQAFGADAPDTGTSAACPVAAGCVAALRTKLSPTATPPANLFAQFRATARPKPTPGWNGDYGHGIIDPDAAAQSLGV
ncbi:MAG: S8 family serine peptidase [Proteobacteria bacterium]|nr:S8 family serine peptidase [Pseudomonadota bacterium]